MYTSMYIICTYLGDMRSISYPVDLGRHEGFQCKASLGYTGNLTTIQIKINYYLKRKKKKQMKHRHTKFTMPRKSAKQDKQDAMETHRTFRAVIKPPSTVAFP